MEIDNQDSAANSVGPTGTTNLRRLPFWPTIAADLNRYGEGVSLRSFLKSFVLNPGFKYTVWMRLAGALRTMGPLTRPLDAWCRLAHHRCSVKYGISIPYNTRVGPGLYIGHYGGIVVSDQAEIGRDCNINHGVTIGVKYGGKSPGVPRIGDRVYLGPGAKVIGGILVGDDSAIGANSVVVSPVPDRGVVAGVPARLISTRGSETYVVNTGWDGDH